MKTKENKNPKKKKSFMLLGIGLGILTLGGGFGYWYYKGKKNPTENTESDFLIPSGNNKAATTKKNISKTNPPLPEVGTSKPNSGNPVPSPNEKFPLKAGSKSDLVKQVQQALILKYGQSILPKFGADGQFGKELSDALLSKGFSVTLDEAAFNKVISLNPTFVQPSTKGSLTSAVKESINIAKNIWLYATIKKLNPLLEQLKRIATIALYVKVNELFKTIRLNGIHQTIVNGTLSVFSDETSKQLLRAEFLRIGLKYDGTKWALAGLREKQIITNQETTICTLKGITLEVPSQTILGIEVGRIRNLTHFRTLDNHILYVPTKHINYV